MSIKPSVDVSKFVADWEKQCARRMACGRAWKNYDEDPDLRNRCILHGGAHRYPKPCVYEMYPGFSMDSRPIGPVDAPFNVDDVRKAELYQRLVQILNYAITRKSEENS